MTRYYFHDHAGHLVPYPLPFKPGMMRTLLGQAGPIDEVIDRAIDALGPDTNGAVIEGSVQDGVVTVAVALKVKGDWTVTLAGERRKDGALAGRFQVKHAW